jgi:voltage-gated potassium channel
MSNKNSDNQSLKDKIHEIVFGAHTPAGLAFDITLLIAIVLSVISNSLETVKEGSDQWHLMLMIAKWVFTGLFTVEYAVRIYCVRKPWKYIFSFWGIIDLLAILPDYLLAIFGGTASFSAIRSLRLLRVFRILNLSWFQQEGEDLGNAIWRARGKIIVFLMVVMIIVTVAGTVMYEVENAFGKMIPNPDYPENGPPKISESQFTSIPIGIYWAIVTMTTVGFGDIIPLTTGGKFISAILILVGYSLIIVPTGFVSAEVLDGKKMRMISTISCPSCLSEDHDATAVYCKFCGEKMKRGYSADLE